MKLTPRTLLRLEYELHIQRFERNAQTIIARALRRNIADTIEWAKTGDPLPDNLWSDQYLKNAYVALYLLVAPAFAVRAQNQIGREMKNLEDPAFYENYALEIAGSKIRGITAQGLDQVRAILARNPGVSPDQIARALRKEFPKWTRTKARSIARTEVVTASNMGSLRGAMNLGSGLQKEWLAAFKNTRDSHAAAHGQKVETAAEFMVGGEFAQFPGDPKLSAGERINCRCSLAFSI